MFNYFVIFVLCNSIMIAELTADAFIAENGEYQGPVYDANYWNGRPGWNTYNYYRGNFYLYNFPAWYIGPDYPDSFIYKRPFYSWQDDVPPYYLSPP